MKIDGEKPSTNRYQRTLSIARAKNLGGRWTPDPKPLVPTAEQVETSWLDFDALTAAWFLFTNHVGVD